MKKIFVITIVVLMLTFALASCGGGEQVTTTTTQPPVHIHNYAEWEIIQEPTCTEKGEKVRYCSCGEKQSEVILALGHTPAEVVEENRVEATCYAEGGYDNVVYCFECKAELERASYTLSKVEHTPASAVEENRVNATHEKDGSYQMVVYCAVAECHAELERTTHVIDMLVHHPGNVVVENQVAATCTKNGSYDEVIYCLDDDCGHKELSRKTVSVPMVAHTPADAVEENRVEATCTTKGSYDEVVYCANCGAQMSRIKKVINMVSHIESDWIVDKEATTTEEGLKHTECVVCKSKIHTESIPKIFLEDIVVVSLTIVSYPKRQYYVGEKFDATGLRIMAMTNNWEANYFVEADDLELVVTGFDNSTTAEGQIITVTYKGVSTTYTIDIKEYVIEPTLVSFEVLELKREYTIERWNKNGLSISGAKLKLIYSNDTTEEIPVTWKYISPLPKADTPGTIMITITYGGIVVDVPITITE